MIIIVGVDADDTLWDEATLFAAAEARFVAAVEGWTSRRDILPLLRQLHFRLIDEVGYGPAGYRKALHAFSTGQLEPALRAQAIAIADEVCDEIESETITPLPGIADALDQLRSTFKLVLITKGDAIWQRTKLAHSGLEHHFEAVHVVAEKHQALYAGIFGAAQARPHAAMIGNSVKSDILPAIAAGALGLHVPFHRTSPLEEAEWSGEHQRYHEFQTFGQAAKWLVKQRQPVQSRA